MFNEFAQNGNDEERAKHLKTQLGIAEKVKKMDDELYEHLMDFCGLYSSCLGKTDKDTNIMLGQRSIALYLHNMRETDIREIEDKIRKFKDDGENVMTIKNPIKE